MKLIAHRGNLAGPRPEMENHPTYIDLAIDAGFDVEIDLWEIEGLWMLGHDKPQHIVGHKWLIDRMDNLWVHCKQMEALNGLVVERSPLNYFWHENDQYTLTSKGFVWTNTGNRYGSRSVLVDIDGLGLGYGGTGLYGVCTDYPQKYRY